MPRAKRIRGGDVKLPETWGKVRERKGGVEFAVVSLVEMHRRLRDVAKAAGWENDALFWEEKIAEGFFEGYVPEYMVSWAIYYRGLLSLCEVE